MFRSLLFLNAVCLTQWWIPFLFFSGLSSCFFRMKIIEDSADSCKISRFTPIQWFWVVGGLKYGYGSIPIDTCLVGWTSIYQLFWGEQKVPGFRPIPIFFIFHMGCHHSHWRTHIFQDGYCTTNQLMSCFFSGLAIPWGDEWKALSHSVFDASCCSA